MCFNETYVAKQIAEISLINIKELSQSRIDRLSGYVDAIFLNNLIVESQEIEMRKEINKLKMKLGLLIYGDIPEYSNEVENRPQARV